MRSKASLISLLSAWIFFKLQLASRCMDTVAAHKSETLFCFANFVTLGPDSAFKSRTIRGVVKRSVCVTVSACVLISSW